MDAAHRQCFTDNLQAEIGGAAITIITGRGALRSGLRQVLFGVAAAAITFGVGRLVGSTLAGYSSPRARSRQ